MSFQCEELPDGNVALLGELDLTHVRDAKEALCGLLARPGISSLNLSGITEIDFAGVQVLLAAKRDADGLNKPLAFAQPSAAVDEAFELLGIVKACGSEGRRHGA